MSDSEIAEAIAKAEPRSTRNVCLIAHVDHGKTTFADALLTTNGVVSNRLTGKMRFLDTREDEQTRGITMKASVTSIVFPPLLINLVDSPGHVDFVGEVADGLLLADIALLLVDVVEGVCSQTEALLRRAITQEQQVVLVLNKLDRLKNELKMSEADAFAHIKQLILATNSCLSQVIRGLLLEDDESWSKLEAVEAKMHFDPAQLNVLFSSATHAFAFSLQDFAEIYNKRLKIPTEELVQNLFEDCYLGVGRTICLNASSKGKKSLFEQLILYPIWQLLDAGTNEQDLSTLLGLAEKLGITIKSKRASEALDEVMRRWLPLPRATFRLLARCHNVALSVEGRRLFCSQEDDASELAAAVRACRAAGPVVVFVAKLVQVLGRRLAISRVFSGRLQGGQELHCRSINGNKSMVKIANLFMMRGRDLVPLHSVPAGVVCAVEADDMIPSQATLTDWESENGFMIRRSTEEPLVRVRLSVRRLGYEEKLREELKRLAVFDNTVRIVEQENGELALLTSGEVHLQKCLQDLADAGLRDLDISEPIVPFLETTVADPTLTASQIADSFAEYQKGEKTLHLRVRVVPLSPEVATVLEQLAPALQGLTKADITAMKKSLISAAETTLPVMKGSWWYRMPQSSIRSHFERLWSIGPDKAPANVLFNAVPGFPDNAESEATRRDLDAAIVAAFDAFIMGGPLCSEPMRAVGVVVEQWEVDEQEPGIGGLLMSATRATCIAAAKKTPLRLMAAMYDVTVTTTSQALGKVHAVLAQRKSKIMSEDVDEVSGLFVVRARMAVVESFSFCEQLRKRTSGMASGQMSPSQWEVIDEDPYWQPHTQEEIEEYGMKGDSPNHARGYMDAVRRRKGLPTEDLIVVSAEKQRNLSKNK